jgi:GxxExxY protein
MRFFRFRFLRLSYENALVHEMRKQGMQVCQQHPIRVTYDSVVVGDFVADLLVEDAVLVELKATKAVEDVHVAQCLNYLRATGVNVCLLLNLRFVS